MESVTTVDEALAMNPLESVRRLEKMLVPENVLLFAKSDEHAAVIVALPPSETGVPLMVTEEFWSWPLPMVEVETTLVPLYARS